MGDTLALSSFDAGISTDFPVKVVEIGTRHWKFEALPGHPEGAGRTITFEFRSVNGRNQLHVFTSDNGSVLTELPLYPYNFFGAKRAWSRFANKVKLNYAYRTYDGVRGSGGRA